MRNISTRTRAVGVRSWGRPSWAALLVISAFVGLVGCSEKQPDPPADQDASDGTEDTDGGGGDVRSDADGSDATDGVDGTDAGDSQDVVDDVDDADVPSIDVPDVPDTVDVVTPTCPDGAASCCQVTGCSADPNNPCLYTGECAADIKCQSNADCLEDGDPCTDQFCFNDKCFYNKKSNCSSCDPEAADPTAGCPSNDKCKQWSCPPANTAAHFTKSLCVGGPTDCDDDNPCTADGCDPVTGCINNAIPKSVPPNQVGCDPCTTDGECAFPCKSGACDKTQGICVYADVICQASPDPCIEYTCDPEQDLCVPTPKAGATCGCQADTDCVFGLACETGTCDQGTHQCVYVSDCPAPADP